MNSDMQVLIVGAGPTGLMMAGELARRGVRCRLIDKAPRPSPFSKALAVQARTLELLERIGLADRAVASGRKIHGLSGHSDGKRIIHISLDPIESRYNYVLSIPQSETERLLGEHLAGLGITAEREVELVGLTQGRDAVEAVLRRPDRDAVELFHVPWVIGCDGPHSAVRRELGIPFEGRAFDETFSLADVRLEGDVPDDEVTLYLCHGDLVGLIPMPGARRFRVVIEHHTGTAPQGEEPALAEFQRMIDVCGPRGGARLSDPIWTSRFRISQRRVATYRQGRVFLAGDAAHIHSPVGGQGMNTGIQDACNLAWKLALVLYGRGRPELLDSYQQERQPLGKALLRVTGTSSRVLLWRHPVAEAVRDLLAPVLTSFNLVQDRIRGALSETAVRYRESPIVREYRGPRGTGLLPGWLHAGAGLRAGDRAVDGALRRARDGAEVRLFELMPGTRHTLVLFAGRRLGADAARRRREILSVLAEGYDDLIEPYVVLPVPEADGGGVPELFDAGGALHRPYGADDETLYVIRPDGYIGFRSQPAAAEPLRSYLQAYLLPAAPAPAALA
jgi:2-polyprenyl-6-methoxyphenol hydroxylase-like FAD-dependent oxidoreductase